MSLIENKDLNDLIDLQKIRNDTMLQFGILRFEAKKAESQFLNKLAEIEKEQYEISKKYGEGSFNLDSGEFTPAEGTEQVPEVKIPKLKLSKPPKLALLETEPKKTKKHKPKK